MSRCAACAVVAGVLVASCVPLAAALFAAEAPTLPEAGRLAALPERTVKPVPLTNPGFEEDWAGWKPSKAPAFSITAEGAHLGKACLRFDLADGQSVTRALRPDSADWFSVPAAASAR